MAGHFPLEEPMADEMAGLGDRQGSLEGRVAVLEVTVEREAGLRAKMDRDLSDVGQTLKAHTRSLQALHDTQQDHTRSLTRIEDRLGNVEDRLGNVEGRLGSVEEKLGTVQVGVHAILDLLDTNLARGPRLTLPFPRRKRRPQNGPADGA
jgi:chromosome segregation ATPase